MNDRTVINSPPISVTAHSGMLSQKPTLLMNGNSTFYYQVALSVRDADTLQRELRHLLSIRDHYPKYILTMDDDPEEQYDGIRRINARDWLLGLTD